MKNTDILYNFYLERGYQKEKAENAVTAAESFLKYEGNTPEHNPLDILKNFLSVQTGRLSAEEVIALGRYFYLTGQNDRYIYITSINEREKIIDELKTRTINICGESSADRIFQSISSPLPGSPPAEAVQVTRKLTKKLLTEAGPETAEKILTGNMHRIPPQAFEKEKKYSAQSESLSSYLDSLHSRSTAELQEYADSGKVWYEQKINQAAVEFVKNNPEVLGGVLKEDGKIYITKIPYNPAEWLNEQDPEKKRYLYCHCPMAREALNSPENDIPKIWCYCSAGFAKQKFDSIFECETEIELLESVLDGGNVCRFALKVPEKYLSDNK